MKSLLHGALVMVTASVLLAFPRSAPAQSPSRGKGFEAFRLLQTRNVFDPNRRGPRNEESRSESRPRSDSFTLTGTMVTESKSLAFFNGSRSDYNRVLPIGATIAQFQVKTIGAGQVELERDGKVVTLSIGRTMQLDAGSGPQVVDGPSQPPPDATTDTSSSSSAPPAPGAAPSTSTSPAAPGSAAPGAPKSREEIARQMAERRQKEMSK